MSQKWSFAQIEAGASAIAGSVNTVHGLLDEGRASLGRLATVWGGSGSDSYQQVQRRWDQTALELNNSLQSLSRTISQASQAMASTERGVAGKFA